jgi:hypothetical protein
MRLKIEIKAMLTDPFSSFSEYTAGSMRQWYQKKLYKGKVKTHNYIKRQNQSTTGKL